MNHSMHAPGTLTKYTNCHQYRFTAHCDQELCNPLPFASGLRRVDYRYSAVDYRRSKPINYLDEVIRNLLKNGLPEVL